VVELHDWSGPSCLSVSEAFFCLILHPTWSHPSGRSFPQAHRGRYISMVFSCRIVRRTSLARHFTCACVPARRRITGISGFSVCASAFTLAGSSSWPWITNYPFEVSAQILHVFLGTFSRLVSLRGSMRPAGRGDRNSRDQQEHARSTVWS
jgi:hypothetical protein